MPRRIPRRRSGGRAGRQARVKRRVVSDLLLREIEQRLAGSPAERAAASPLPTPVPASMEMSEAARAPQEAPGAPHGAPGAMVASGRSPHEQAAAARSADIARRAQPVDARTSTLAGDT